ncbi:hypothetical protein GF391_02970 [Candidatus Uhrbacteria bacterium]|nr:hypothetical protein [Candidatus Uhrbacteria bacterium]
MQEYFIIYRRKAPKASRGKQTELQRVVVKGDSIYQAVRAFHDKHDSNECDIKAVLERDLVADISRLL